MEKSFLVVKTLIIVLFVACLISPAWAVDTTRPVLTQVTPVKVRTNDTTPSYTFSTNEGGTILYWNSCISSTRTAFAGNNLISFSALPAGSYSTCTLSVQDAAGNVSAPLSVSAFTIDLAKPVLAKVIAIPAQTTDTTPDFTFSTTEAGSIIYGGSCASTKVWAIKGSNIVTLKALEAGTYSDCTIKVKDAAGNVSLALAINSFSVVVADTIKPVLAQVSAVKTPTNDTTPNYTFSSTEGGTLVYGGSCKSVATTVAAPVAPATTVNKTITFNVLVAGTYSNCTLTVKDAAGNLSTPLAIPAFTVNVVIVATQPLNDTGIKLCGDKYNGFNNSQNNLDCSATGTGISINGIDAEGDVVPAGQDALYGRDVNSATNSDADGVAGFSFTKLDANGNALAIQSGIWSDSGSESAGTKWSCVKDNVTGLIWEIKTNDGGLRDKDWTYSWFNWNSTTNGGSAGSFDYSDNCYVNYRCNTQKYVKNVNEVNLCGETANNWRLPSQQELLSIVANDRVNPAIDVRFFADTPSGFFWSASPTASYKGNAWCVDFRTGHVDWGYKSNTYSVRLVRGSN